jgi:hypothetical protein
MGAGHYQPDNRSGAMHGGHFQVRDLYYGTDSENLYLRLDFEDHPDFTAIEMRTPGATISLVDNAAVRVAQKKILEAQIPFGVLGPSKNSTLQFQLAIVSGNQHADILPPDGWLEVNTAL